MLGQAFPRLSGLVYANFKTARDQLLLHTCCIKILDTLVDLQAQQFSSDDSDRTVDATRAFLMEAQKHLSLLQATCRSAVDLVPFFIGLVDSRGNTSGEPWNFNDTGILTIQSPLRTIEKCNYVTLDIKSEITTILKLFEAHKRIIKLT